MSISLGQDITQSQQTFQALARELKIPLVAISAQAEILGQDNIRQQAISAMTLIDSFLMVAQTDYGQTQLKLEPVAVGSVLYQVQSDARSEARSLNRNISTVVAHDNLIMTNRRGLQLGLQCLMNIVLSNSSDVKEQSVVLNSYKRKDGKIYAGVFSEELALSRQDLAKFQDLAGVSHQAATNHLNGSGVQLAIAQQIAASIGASLESLKKGKLRGLGFELMKSNQLKLV